ncbi:toxin AnmTx Cj 1c-1-like [Tubulanus polymorphus]|uniref:toxin AnmTx Cj 1c-1-like n=1 Tax=Tubulanus polymorphus TaxID=672921 RepID=UPI003DA4B15B
MKIFILIVAVVIATVAAKGDIEELVQERYRRGVRCRCETDKAPPDHSGTLFYKVGCDSGWHKCIHRPKRITTCCKRN